MADDKIGVSGDGELAPGLWSILKSPAAFRRGEWSGEDFQRSSICERELMVTLVKKDDAGILCLVNQLSRLSKISKLSLDQFRLDGINRLRQSISGVRLVFAKGRG